MGVMQDVGAYRNELALVIGRPGRLGIPAYVTGPEQVVLPMTHTVHIGFHIVVGLHRHLTGIILIGAYGVITVLQTPFRPCRTRHQTPEHIALELFRTRHIGFFQKALT